MTSTDRRPARHVLLTVMLLSLAAIATVQPCEAQQVRFNEHIRPILAEHCLHCHGPDESQRQAGLRLDLEQAAKESAVVAGDPDTSELIQRVTTDDPDLRMPPPESGKTLTEVQIERLKAWIAGGAAYEGHWAYEPIVDHAPPVVAREVSTDIDRFIVQRLQQAGLELSPPLNRRQWIRRVTFDLIGLPPSWEDVQRFVSDPSPDAFEKVVNRLLDSPRYGERWGRHWLDLARYADTHGGSAIGFTRFPFSYTYRDYVIAAFNRDLPYDQFVTEQIAADQLERSPGDPALAGLGFLSVGRQFRSRHDRIDDQIDVVTRGLMGMTVACARCHDHKFDQIPTRDYYAIYAALASSEPPETLPVIGTPPSTDAYRNYQAELDRRRVARDDMRRDQAEVMRNRLRMQIGLYLREIAKGTSEQDTSIAFLSFRTDDLRPHILNRWLDYLATMTADDAVFGPWVQLSAVDAEQFVTQRDELLRRMQQQNGDAEKYAKQHLLGSTTPKWNPRVVEAIAKSEPATLLELADVYGNVFAETQKRWMQELLQASLEASPDGQVVPDQDARHAVINSAIERQLRRHLHADGSPTAVDDELAAQMLNRSVRDNFRSRENAIHNLNLSSPGSPPRAMVLQEDKQAGPFHVFHRGNPLARGEPVRAGFLSAVRHVDDQPATPGLRRLQLAQRIVDPANPLTRRVIVNWVWQHHFGLGLVRTPDDFGTRGQPPTHPQLLDYLASRLLDDGWSLKKLHRRIVLSDVYRQAAVEDDQARTIDPDNRLLWRMPRRRLDLEAMRDAMLVVSGELSLQPMGGRPFEPLADPIVPRRSVYAFVNRDIVSPLARTFDAANPSSCTAKRPETSVPQQTLFALNSRFIQDRAAAMATLSQQQASERPRERVQWMYRTALSRSASDQEIDLALKFVQTAETARTSTAETDNTGSESTPAVDGWSQLAHVLLATNEFVFVD